MVRTWTPSFDRLFDSGHVPFRRLPCVKIVLPQALPLIEMDQNSCPDPTGEN